MNYFNQLILLGENSLVSIETSRQERCVIESCPEYPPPSWKGGGQVYQQRLTTSSHMICYVLFRLTIDIVR